MPRCGEQVPRLLAVVGDRVRLGDFDGRRSAASTASRISHFLSVQSQPMSESSIGSTPSRLASVQHHAVPQRSRGRERHRRLGERRGLRAFALRRVLVEVRAGARGVDDEHALRARRLHHLVHRPGHLADTPRGGLAPVVVPHVADDDRRLLRVPRDRLLTHIGLRTRPQMELERTVRSISADRGSDGGERGQCGRDDSHAALLQGRSHGFVRRLGEHGQPFLQSFQRDGQRRGDLHGLAPGADGGEEEEAFVEAALDDACARSWSGSFLPRRRVCMPPTRPRALTWPMTSGCRAWIFCKPSSSTGSSCAALPARFSRMIFLHAGERGGAADGVAGVRARHGAGAELIHDRFAADHGGDRQRTADAFAAADEVGRRRRSARRPRTCRCGRSRPALRRR